MAFRIVKDNHIDALVVDGQEALFNHDVHIRGNLKVDGYINDGTVTNIVQTDLPLVITTPGNYRFSENLVFSPLVGSTAITIDSNDVNLSLSGLSLSQGNSTTRTIGIHVLTGHSNVSIVNGTIKNFTQLGLVVDGGNSRIFLGEACSNIVVSGCGRGSTLSFFDNIALEPILQGGIRLGESKALESKGYYTWLGNIDTVNLVNVFCEENGPVGLYLGTGSNIISENCYFCKNSDDRETGITDPFATGVGNANTCIVVGMVYSAHPGFGDNDSNTVEFQGCHFDGNTNNGTGLAQFSAGLTIGYNINGLTFRKCTFNSNRGLGGTGGRGMFGAILGGCKGVLYEGCEATFNYNENAPTEGFHHSGVNGSFNYIISPEGVTYRECTANNNTCQAEVFPTASGFNLFFMDGFIMEDCTASNNAAVATDPDNAFGFADGLSLIGADDPGGQMKNGVIRGCNFSSNSVNFAGGDVEGIYIQAPVSQIVMEDCVIQSNNGTGGDFNSGIWIANFGSGTNAIVIEDCVIERQNYGVFSLADANGVYQRNEITNCDNGIFLSGTTCTLVSKNSVTNSIVGFEDDGVSSSSLFAKNKTFTVTTPFNVTYPFGPISTAPGGGLVNGDLSAGFPGPANALDNIDMTNPLCAPVAPLFARTEISLKQKIENIGKIRTSKL